MKISLNEIKRLGYDELVRLPIDELVNKIGSQLGEVEGIESLGAMYQDVIVAKVVSVAKHPNADRLNICMIDDAGAVKFAERNENGHVQVVCGAPNVREGLLVAWLPPGATVPETFKQLEPFRLEVRELRGVKSNGMIASARELALGDDHEGILEIDAEAKPGQAFVEAYNLDDYIIDIENKMFTHRPDCFGLLGVARELAGIQQQPFNSPDWYKVTPSFETSGGLNLEIDNPNTDLVPRFMAVSLSSVEIKPSPDWLQTAILRLGSRPINNVVDITNYLMLVTGQPLHAYDYDKVKSGKLGARMAHDGEQLTLLNDKTIKLDTTDIVITDGEKPIGLAGVMGGADTEVSDATKNIILEIATFDMYAIRRTSMRHGLFTDAVARFNKGQSPAQNDRVMVKAVETLSELAGAKQASEVIDNYDKEFTRGQVKISADYINRRLGVKLKSDDMAKLLQNVEFDVETTEDELAVRAPFWRTDIEIKEDVVEEIGRLYGYDNLPLELPKRSVKPAAKNSLFELKQTIRERLAKAGANEVLTYSFVHENLLTKSGQDKQHAYQLSNALSPDLQYYRPSLMPSLLEKVHPNIKAGFDEFALFELGKAHIKDQLDSESLPREDELTALVVTAADKLKKTGAAYYAARKYLVNLVGAKLSFKPIPQEMRAFDITKPYAMERAAFIYVGDKFLGLIGEFSSSAAQQLKLPKYCAGFELDTTALLEVLDADNQYVSLPRFPEVTQDVTLKVPADLPYQELYDFVWNELGKVQPAHSLPALEPLSIYQREEDVAHKQITLRFIIASYQQTLTAEQVNTILNQVSSAARDKYGAERV